MTSPALIFSAMIAFMHSGSELNTRAGPVIEVFFSPVVLATQPSGASLALRIASGRCGADDFLPLAWLVRHPGEFHGHGPAGDGEAIAVQHAVLEQYLQYLGHAA